MEYKYQRGSLRNDLDRSRHEIISKGIPAGQLTPLMGISVGGKSTMERTNFVLGGDYNPWLIPYFWIKIGWLWATYYWMSFDPRVMWPALGFGVFYAIFFNAPLWTAPFAAITFSYIAALIIELGYDVVEIGCGLVQIARAWRERQLRKRIRQTANSLIQQAIEMRQLHLRPHDTVEIEFDDWVVSFTPKPEFYRAREQAEINRATQDVSTLILKEMVETYGSDDGLGPISIITNAVRAIRLIDPDYQFGEY